MSLARPVTSLLRCALAIVPALLAAVDSAPMVPSPPIPRGGPGLTPISEIGAGTKGIGAGRQVVVQGMIDLDLLQRTNYGDGLDSASDHRGYGTLRANLGMEVKLDDKAKAVIGFGYYSDLGDYGTTNKAAGPTLTVNESQRNSAGSQVVLSDAYIRLNQFLHFDELGVKAGRMPVDWSLVDDRDRKETRRPVRGAFLYDSRANNPVIESWDGVTASWSGWEGTVIHPWAYRLPDAASLWGFTFDWKPGTTRGSDKVFITGTYAEQRKAVLADGTIAPQLKTYSGGFDWQIDDVSLWAELAGQRGDAGSNRNFSGMGAEVGWEWQYSPYGKGRFQLISDWLTGDDFSEPGSYRAFVNKWESISDTLIAENEKYGELTGLLVGNLHAFKARWGIGLNEHDEVRVELTGAYYKVDRQLPGGGGRTFGTEVDAQLIWQYTHNAQIRLFAGVFKPGGAMTTAMENRAAALSAPITAGRDLILLGGINLNVVF